MYHLIEESKLDRCSFDERCTMEIHFLNRKHVSDSMDARSETSADTGEAEPALLTVQRLMEILKLIRISETTVSNWQPILAPKLQSTRTDDELNSELLTLWKAGIITAIYRPSTGAEAAIRGSAGRISWSEGIIDYGVPLEVISSALRRTDYGVKFHEELEAALKSIADPEDLMKREIAP